MKFVIALIVSTYVALQEVTLVTATGRTEALLDAFKHGDADHNGKLATSEIPNALQHLHTLVTDFTITKEAVAEFDMNNDQHLNVIEFASALGHNKYFEGHKPELDAFFHMIDKATGEDKHITPQDLHAFMQTLSPESKITLPEIEAFMTQLEEKANMVKNQKLDIKEFEKVITGH